MTEFDQTLANALTRLSSITRSDYAKDVLYGRQRWSGNDLRGKARKYGAGYAQRRRYASQAWFEAGGCIVGRRCDGLLISAVAVGQDDFGNALFQVRDGRTINPDALRP